MGHPGGDVGHRCGMLLMHLGVPERELVDNLTGVGHRERDRLSGRHIDLGRLEGHQVEGADLDREGSLVSVGRPARAAGALVRHGTASAAHMATGTVALTEDAREHQDHQHDENEADDPEHLHPPWGVRGRSPTGLSTGPRGRRSVGHVRLLFSQARYSAPYRDMMSLSNHCVSILNIMYARVVPKLWTETIEAHRREVRDAIQDTTATLVAEHGLRSVTMSQIAEDTGIGRATLYKYFPDVEAILYAWHERQIKRHLEQLTQVRDQARDTGERLEAVLHAFALIAHESHGHHDSELAAFLHRDEQVSRAEHKLRRMVRELLTEAAAAGDLRDDVAPEELASYCLHALAAARSLESKAAVRRLVAVTLAGLRSRA
jgi:AcrR family transcriptional regulator